MSAGGTSKAKLMPIFTTTVTELAKGSLANGQAATGGKSRVWQTPPLGGWQGDHSDIAGMVSPFDRTDINDLYAQCISDAGSPGTDGDLIALVTQIGYVGAMERAYRARHASPVRCLINAAGRRIGHGQAAGVLRGGAVGYIQDVIAAGQTN